MFFGERKLVARVRSILGWVGGGVHKRIDENRELLELLQREAPAFLARHDWVTEWLQSHDDFFAELAAAVPLTEGQFLARAMRNGSGFPRQWPGKARETIAAGRGDEYTGK